MLRWLTAGESHGPALVAILEGLPAGVELTSDDIRAALARRRLGYGRGARQKFETDEIRVLGGLRHGQSIGGPLAIEIGNSEWPKWEDVMSADPVPAEALLVDAGTGDEREVSRNRPLTRPRPGHADLAGLVKYGFDDTRPVLERASARETAARVALGAAAREFLRQVAGIEIFSHVVAIGSVEVPDDAPLPTAADAARIDADPVRCADPATSALMIAEIDAAKKDADTLGGVVEIIAEVADSRLVEPVPMPLGTAASGSDPDMPFGTASGSRDAAKTPVGAAFPIGLGSYVHGDRRLDARLAGALMSIPAIKGVEVGDGFRTARRRGSAAHDELVPQDGAIHRLTNRAGGIEGGMSNGSAIRVRIAMKPISTVPRALRSVDLATGAATIGNHQRSDTCAVPAAGVVGEAMVALELANALIEKFGGDSVTEIRRALDSWADSGG